jgi:hypothetical protein
MIQLDILLVQALTKTIQFNPWETNPARGVVHSEDGCALVHDEARRDGDVEPELAIFTAVVVAGFVALTVGGLRASDYHWRRTGRLGRRVTWRNR